MLLQAINYLAEKGYDPQFGARPVKRIIQREVLNELSKEILKVTESIIFDLKNTETINTVEVAIQELKLGIENMQNLLSELKNFINHVESNQ